MGLTPAGEWSDKRIALRHQHRYPPDRIVRRPGAARLHDLLFLSRRGDAAARRRHPTRECRGCYAHDVRRRGAPRTRPVHPRRSEQGAGRFVPRPAEGPHRRRGRATEALQGSAAARAQVLRGLHRSDEARALLSPELARPMTQDGNRRPLASIKLLLINPNTTAAMTERMVELAQAMLPVGCTVTG